MAQYDVIQSNTFNGWAGGNPTTTANTLNAVWATGGGQAGYGQTANVPANVAIGQVIALTNWASLMNGINNANAHQNGAATGVTTPTAGSVVQWPTNMTSALGNIYAARANAVSQGSTATNTQTTAAAWTDYANFAFTVSFANGDAARYFFNSGGQLKFSSTHANTTAGINAAMNTLCTAAGTVVMSGQNTSANANIAGSNYAGLTKVGGSGSTETFLANAGYNGLVTGNTVIFDQNSGTAPYTATVQIQIIANTTTANVSGNGDNGNIVRVWYVLDKISGNGTIGSGSTCTCTVVPPETTYLSNSWGAITLSGANTTA